ncbi:hypothetical protein ACOCG7_34635 (plasmid) [Paraburkholderia sp. DD10]|uniref:hypothetical protein n=1 Tax=Paraburkholderia sp. DD10 TaxID=3409691 RepID=UPI003BA01F53
MRDHFLQKRLEIMTLLAAISGLLDRLAGPVPSARPGLRVGRCSSFESWMDMPVGIARAYLLAPQDVRAIAGDCALDARAIMDNTSATPLYAADCGASGSFHDDGDPICRWPHRRAGRHSRSVPQATERLRTFHLQISPATHVFITDWTDARLVPLDAGRSDPGRNLHAQGVAHAWRTIKKPARRAG